MPEIILMLHFSKFSDALFTKDCFLFHNKIKFITGNNLSWSFAQQIGGLRGTRLDMMWWGQQTVGM